MKFLANENIPLTSVYYLKSLNYDIKAIGLDQAGITDQEVMKIAIEEVRTIITYDSDYGELIFKFGYRPEAGVIFIRFQPEQPLDTGKLVEKLVGESRIQFNRALTVVDSNSIRQKIY